MEERIILKGRSKTLEPIITEILALHQMFRNRDIGEFTGYPLDEYVRARPQSFKLKVLFYSIEAPHWKAPNNGKLVRATYHVPFIQRTKIDWETIKQACGGNNGYLWGRFLCTCNVIDDDGSMRQMQVYGSSEAEAEQRLKALLTLSSGKIATLSITEEKKEGRRATDKLLYKDSTRVYPAYFTIVNMEKIITESNVATIGGNYVWAKARIPLWTSTKPPDCDEQIREAIRVKGSSTPATP